MPHSYRTETGPECDRQDSQNPRITIAQLYKKWEESQCPLHNF
ncbi:hypothetical protein [Oscillatoria acuminata]|nr:hypothetical protein [Oscillatoria acuminata]